MLRGLMVFVILLYISSVWLLVPLLMTLLLWWYGVNGVACIAGIVDAVVTYTIVVVVCVRCVGVSGATDGVVVSVRAVAAGVVVYARCIVVVTVVVVADMYAVTHHPGYVGVCGVAVDAGGVFV